MKYRISIMIFFVSLFTNDLFAQKITGDNFDIEVIDKDCRSGFYLGKYSDRYPNPFSTSSKDFLIEFGVPDSSNLRIRIFSADSNKTIVKFNMDIDKGCYQLNWIEQNIEKLRSGIYFCSLEVHQRNRRVVSDFNAILKTLVYR
ncbi:MAG TPA: hypothetical protein PKA90_06355 [Ignavibacteria bacterium]|nr:hypothetical protein [Ignavibacteria bacterium]HMR40037.1 hypothetical protein [Ignavibacteria bacterium]